MADKLAEYRAGRNRGLEIALEEVKANGVESLEKLIKFYGETSIPPTLTRKDLDDSCNTIKAVTIDTIVLASCATLHDVFGFGEKRLRDFMTGMAKLTYYLENGWLDWWDLIKEIEERTGLKLSIYNGSTTVISSKNREYDDTLNDDPDWKEVLSVLGFQEIENPPKSNCFDVLDDTGEWKWHYENPEDKTRLLFYFWGMQYERKKKTNP